MKGIHPIIGFCKATPKVFVMKLRLTGFESHHIFVIRLCSKSNSFRSGARH